MSSDNGAASDDRTDKGRWLVLNRIFESLKDDKPVVISPCGLKLLSCNLSGVKEIPGFEELELRDQLYVVKVLLEVHEDVCNKFREIAMKKAAKGPTQPRGMSQLIAPTTPTLVPGP